MMFIMIPNILLEIKVALVATVLHQLQLFLRCSGRIAKIVSTKVIMIKEQTKCFPAILGIGCTLDVNLTRIAATDVLRDLPNLEVVKLVSGTSVRTASNHLNVHHFISSGRVTILSGQHYAR
jgi:hypothetical protein